VSDQILEEAGVLGEATIHEMPLYFMPVAEDVLSLELDTSLSDLYLVRLHTVQAMCNKLMTTSVEKSGLYTYFCKSTYAITAETWLVPTHYRERR
jgi:ABC-type uncharacterized transport system involved in gliding motility auxiliary subunit